MIASVAEIWNVQYELNMIAYFRTFVNTKPF